MVHGLLSRASQVFPAGSQVPVAQRIELPPSKREAAGSSPAGGTQDAPWTEEEISRASGRLLVRGPSECWPTTGSRFEDGYGRFFARSRDYQLHRVILEGKIGRRLGPDERARHTCDNPPCGNPDHLVPGSTRDNNHDSLRRDRRQTKVSPAQVNEIRAAAAGLSWGGLTALAKRYGVTPQYVGRIVRGVQRTVLPDITAGGAP